MATPKPAAKWILTATILGSSMAFIDGTVVNVALPALQKDMNATVVGVQWVVEAYSLLLAALLLVGGAMGDRYAENHAVEAVLCGHIHSACTRQIGAINYYNCGDWVETCSALVENFDGEIELIRVSPHPTTPPVHSKTADFAEVRL